MARLWDNITVIVIVTAGYKDSRMNQEDITAYFFLCKLAVRKKTIPENKINAFV